MALAFSVNTNPSAFTALQALNGTNRDLTVVQNRINTGLKVAGAKDDSAIFAIAQNLRSDLGGLNAIKQSLDRASGALDVGIAAAEAISDLLIEAKEKALAASDPSFDAASRTALQNDYQAIINQIDDVVAQAEFNGTNIVNSARADAISALVSDDATQTISVSGADLNTAAGALSLTITTFGAASAATAAVAQVEAALTSVNSTLATFGSAARQIELQGTFADRLSDTIETGIGNLVDADLARESARLQSLQVKQQLGLQALSIANQAPAAILSLFG